MIPLLRHIDDFNSSPLTIERYGLISDKTVGLVDDLALIYDGNRVATVTDYADKVVLASSLDFDAKDGEASYGYDSDGRLTTDSGRGITSIRYTPDNHPVRTEVGRSSFDNLYSADGRKLKTVAKMQSEAEIQSISITDNTEEAADINANKGDPVIDPVIPIEPIKPFLTEERYYIGLFELTKTYNNIIFEKTRKPGLSRINMSWGYVNSKRYNHEYVPDYQGNIRTVMKGNEVVQQTDYYPYGLPIATSTGAVANRYKYSGKEFEPRAGLNSLDFHARQYAPALPFFDVLDPKSWDYPGFNPYLYCAANPINNIDPTGKKTECAPGSSTKFRMTYFVGRLMMKAAGIDGVMGKVDALKETIYIKEAVHARPSDRTTNYNKTDRTINWNPREFLLITDETENGPLHVISPLELLSHEGDHAQRSILDPEGQSADFNNEDSVYGNKEDERVILGSETENSKTIGQIGSNDVSRPDHFGTVIHITSSSFIKNILRFFLTDEELLDYYGVSEE